MGGFKAYIRLGSLAVAALSSASVWAYKYPLGRTFHTSFEESAGSHFFADSINITARGSCSGTSCPSSGVRGTVGSGLRFDGVDDCLNYWNLPSLNLKAP